MIPTDPDMTNAMEVFEIGSFLYAKGDFKESIPYFRSALKLAEPQGDLETTWNILTNLGSTLGDSGEFDEALYCFKEAIVIDRQRNNRKSEVTHLIKIGEIYLQQGDLVTGSEYAKIALSLLKQGIEKNASEQQQIEMYFSNFLETLYYNMRSQNLIENFVELLE